MFHITTTLFFKNIKQVSNIFLPTIKYHISSIKYLKNYLEGLTTAHDLIFADIATLHAFKDTNIEEINHVPSSLLPIHEAVQKYSTSFISVDSCEKQILTALDSLKKKNQDNDSKYAGELQAMQIKILEDIKNIKQIINQQSKNTLK